MAQWWKRYEHILEAKPVEARLVLRDLLARECAELCRDFPPAAGTVSWLDPNLERRIGGRMAELPRPDEALVRVVSQLVVWDLEHENGAIDSFIRNARYREACPTADHETVMHFLWRGILEHLAVRKEEAEGRLRTADVVEAARAIPEQWLRLERQA